MRSLRSLQVPAAIVALSLVAQRLANATQAPVSSPQSGTVVSHFVEHPDNVQPGLASRAQWARLVNPYAANAQRASEGAKLFVSYNCMDCHGGDGSGAMGPSLQDGRWHFGGTPGDIFQSIYEGRPDGMPSWGGRIGDDQIWRLVTYIQTLDKGHSVTTENFTGRTIDRGGR
ncbi:MAG: c-type cytochrome [Gemmatimonadaceae bacterium]